MRADRLVSLVLLLRQHGRMTATELAERLEVSTRTVLRDVASLAVADIPIEAARGRYGGFTLEPGLRPELTGLSPDEALALLVAGSRPGAQSFGLGPVLASAMLKVVDALPEAHRGAALDGAQRLLVDPDVDLLERPREEDDIDDDVLASVRRAVLDGRRLALAYQGVGRPLLRAAVDPVGLVTVRGRGYLLAVVEGEDRTYRLSRIVSAEVLDDAAHRPEHVDLERLWRERAARFRAGGDLVAVRLRLRPGRRAQLEATALALREAGYSDPEWLDVEAVFQDRRHAEWAVWQFDLDAEALEPPDLREALANRAHELAARYADGSAGARE